MLALFKPAASAPTRPTSPAVAQVPDAAAEFVPVQDAHGSDPPSQPDHEVGPRSSSASMPTIDSTPTVHGPPADVPQTPVQSRPHPLPVAASLVPPPHGSALSVHTQSSAHSDRPMQSQSQSALPYSPSSPNSAGKSPRRFSFPFSFLRSDAKQNRILAKVPPPLRTKSVSGKKSKPSRTLSVLIAGTAASSEKRAKESAAVIRSVIVGENDVSRSRSITSKAKLPSKSDLARVKTQLLEPKAATKIIFHLRTLPSQTNATTTNAHPIHAVSLHIPEKDIHDRHFAQVQSVATASISAISAVLADLQVVNLFTAPNMGFGAPVTAQGLFAGALPTAETVIEGIEHITPQLMALGYATGKEILPDHKGIIVPADRISALTYWWGFEICLPSPTLAHLAAAESPGNALLNLLTAISILNDGVREILPFIRYIAQFVQSEWAMIKRADNGRGVVCTATWLLPVALVPRPWDFTDPPPQAETGAPGQTTPTSPSIKRFSATLATPKPSTEVPSNNAPRSSSAYSAETKDEEESIRPVISNQPPVLPELVVSSPGSIDGAHPGSGDEESHNAYEKAQHNGEAIAH